MTHEFSEDGKTSGMGHSVAVDARLDDVSDLRELEPPVRRFVGSLVTEAHDVDDIVQETLVRMLPARERLEATALTAYAITVARNLVHDLHRTRSRRRDLLPRLVEDRSPEQPDALAVAAEERRALRMALDRLPEDQRDLMIAHDVHGAPLDDLSGDGSAGSVAARLSRVRARTRVDYVLALRRVELPSERCRPVLNAVSAGDQRRQGVLRAGRHIVTCEVCAGVAPVLLQRDRALAGVLPWAWLGAGLAGLVAAARRHPLQAGTAAVGTAAMVTVAVVAGSPSPAPAAPVAVATPAESAAAPSVATFTSTGYLRVGGRRLPPTRAGLAVAEGLAVLARSVPVTGVPADEGFWVGEPDRRTWVQLSGRGESAVTVRPGDRVSFTGRLVTQRPGFAARVGVGETQGADLLRRQGHHLEVVRAQLTVP